MWQKGKKRYYLWLHKFGLFRSNSLTAIASTQEKNRTYKIQRLLLKFWRWMLFVSLVVQNLVPVTFELELNKNEISEELSTTPNHSHSVSRDKYFSALSALNHPNFNSNS